MDSSRELLELLQTHAPVGLAFLDGELRIRRVNPAFAAMQGVTVADLEGQALGDVTGALWPQFEPLLRRVLDHGHEIVNAQVRGELPLRPGEWGSWLLSLYPVLEGRGTAGVSCVLVDVSEHHRAEQFRAVVTETMVEGLVGLDHEGCVQYVNAAACELLGFAEEELCGHPFAVDEPAVADARVVGRTTRSVEAEFRRADGRLLPVAYSAAPLPGGDGSVRGVVIVFRDRSAERQAEQRERSELEALARLSQLRSALDEHRLVLHAQPIVPLAGGRPSEELLVRMIGRDGSIIPPCEFLPLAEEYGLVTEVDRWVIRQAARLAGSGRSVHVNLSAKSTTDPGLFSFIEQELRAWGAAPEHLWFELTETALMSDWEIGTAFAHNLVELGCGLALDDFGTGFASLTYLKALPIGLIKIDGDFVRDLADNPTNRHLVQAIVHLAHGLGIETVAEGVEDERTLALLQDYGVDHAQGFHLGRPCPLDDASMAGCTSPTSEDSTS